MFSQLVEADDLQGSVCVQLDDAVSFIDVDQLTYQASVGTNNALHLPGRGGGGRGGGEGREGVW